MSKAYRTLVYWGPRREGVDRLAPRMIRMLNGLSEIDPLLSGWRWSGRSEDVPVEELSPATAARLLNVGRSRDDFSRESVSEEGYRFTIATRWREPDELTMYGRVGCYVPTSTYVNSLTLDTSLLEPPDPRLLKFSLFKSALTFMVTLWSANYASAYPVDLDDVLPRDEKRLDVRLYGGWITYISARWAAKITPPKSAIVERAPDGGLLMIATEETFRVDNPQHVAVAREIDAALAPLNALPWPPNDTADGRAVADR